MALRFAGKGPAGFVQKPYTLANLLRPRTTSWGRGRGGRRRGCGRWIRREGTPGAARPAGGLRGLIFLALPAPQPSIYGSAMPVKQERQPDIQGQQPPGDAVMALEHLDALEHETRTPGRRARVEAATKNPREMLATPKT